MNTTPSLIALALAATLCAACGGDDDSSGDSSGDNAGTQQDNSSAGEAIADRGGPDSLVGESWSSDPVTVNGIELQLAFAFSADTITATSTCEGALSVSTSSPVRYRYSAAIEREARQETSEGEATCFVDIRKATFNFELDGRELVLTDEAGMTTRFEAQGSPRGIYGTWFVETDMFRLEWSMGNGKLRARNVCKDSGLSVTTEAPASFVNLLDIATSNQDSVEEGGLTCDVAIQAGTFTYRLDDQAITLIDANGSETRFAR